MKKISLLSILVCIVTVLPAQTVPQVELAIEQLNRFQNVRDFCISADQDEMYFTIQSPSQRLSQIAVMKKVNGKWSEPELMFFSEAVADMEPFLSPDQLRLYFVSNRIVHPNSIAKQNFDIWYIERKNKECRVGAARETAPSPTLQSRSDVKEATPPRPAPAADRNSGSAQASARSR